MSESQLELQHKGKRIVIEEVEEEQGQEKQTQRSGKTVKNNIFDLHMQSQRL